jgi:hypothetical protein
MYNAIITRLGPIRPHSNADKLMLCTCYGNQIIVGLTDKEGDWGIYFPTDGQLSEDFAVKNDLIRRKDENGNNAGGMFDENRRVRTQKFRGEVSDGYWCSISALEPLFPGIKINDGYIIVDGHKFFDGEEFNTIGGTILCQKYISVKTRIAGNHNQKPAKHKSKMFKEHFDTAQFGVNYKNIPLDALVVLTEKEHGTSQRYGHVQTERSLPWFEKLLKKFKVKIQELEWKYLNGTRRVVINPDRILYHEHDFREAAIKKFKDNLRKGETIYFEVVGWETEGKTIMPSVDNKKMNDKEFVKKYGPVTTFSYGCEPGTFDVVVYRITMTNEDGFSYDLSWNDVKKRAGELGVRHVTELDTFVIRERFWTFNSDKDKIREAFFQYIDNLVKGPSAVDPKHIREGVCVRVEGNLQNLKVYKHKSFEFKVLEGLVKDTGAVDMEESS